MLPKETIERINADADKHAFVVPYDGSNTFYNKDRLESYKTGATAEAERSQRLAILLTDAVEVIEKKIGESDGTREIRKTLTEYNQP